MKMKKMILVTIGKYEYTNEWNVVVIETSTSYITRIPSTKKQLLLRVKQQQEKEPKIERI